MTIHYEDDSVSLWHGDCLDVLRTLPDNSVDSVVTDPPYGLEFMGRKWDSFGKSIVAPCGSTDVPCEACNAAAGEPCREWCVGLAAHIDAVGGEPC